MGKEKNSIEYDLFEDFANVDEENIIVWSVKQAAEKSPQNEPIKKIAKDRGLRGKNRRSAKRFICGLRDLIKVATEEEIEKVPLSKSFPAPNYKKLLES